jgi:hypothetical protein
VPPQSAAKMAIAEASTGTLLALTPERIAELTDD